MISWAIGSASEPPGRRPVRHHVARLGQLAAGRAGVLDQPVPNPTPAGVVVARQGEVHGGSVGSSSRSAHLGGRGVDGESASQA